MSPVGTIPRRLALLGLILMSGPPLGAVQMVAAAAVSCGDVITTDTTLTADLSCECNVTALTVIGPAKLNLGGNTISCTNADPTDTECVLVEGSGATVKNGQVQGCDFGVGGINITNTVIKRIKASLTVVGFIIESSDDNKFVDVESINNRFAGMFILGNRNVVKDSYAGNQPSDSIALEGNDNVIKNSIFEDSLNRNCVTVGGLLPGLGAPQNNVFKNNIFRNCRFAMDYFGGNGTINDNEVYDTSGIVIFSGDNVVKRNYLKDTTSDGIAVMEGSNNVIAENVLENTLRDGIDIRGTAGPSNKVKWNSVYGCGDSGIEIGSNNNLVKENWVFECVKGIEVESGAGNNKLVRNEASASTEFDLFDNSTDCGTNNWKDNDGSGNIPCVEDD